MIEASGSIEGDESDVASSFESDVSWYAISTVSGGPVILQYVPAERQVYSATERDEEIAERRVQFLRARNVPVLESVGDEERWETEMSVRAGAVSP